MKSRRIPVSDVDKKKRGECRLCGRYTYLTKTHVPAQSAGNVGTAQPPTAEIDEEGRETYGLGKERLGGVREYWFCGDCNNRAGEWDKCYTAWSRELQHLLDAGEARVGQRLSVRISRAAAGQFARCLWAWMFAIADDLRAQHPEIASAVLSGEPVQAPRYPRLMLAATREDQITVVVAPHSMVVTAPPFVAFLLTEAFLGVDPGFWRTLRLFDVAPWLMDSADDREDVVLELPIVEMGALPMLGEAVWD